MRVRSRRTALVMIPPTFQRPRNLQRAITRRRWRINFFVLTPPLMLIVPATAFHLRGISETDNTKPSLCPFGLCQ